MDDLDAEAPVLTVRLAAILGALLTPAVLAVVAVTAGLGALGWLVGVAAGWAATAAIVIARLRSDNPAILPADGVTLVRAVLTAGVAGLVADSLGGPPAGASVSAMVSLATVALVLDGVDGQVARRTGTATALGARFDGETDAALILLLSIAAAQRYGGWVLIAGALRYVFLLAGWLVPALAAPLPARYWRKVVAAAAGVVLTVAVSGVIGPLIGTVALVVVVLLLVESFGRDVVWLYRSGAGERSRRVVRRASAAAALVVVWGVLVAPDRLERLDPAAFVRIPVELLVLVAVVIWLPSRARRVVAGLAGVLFGLVAVIKIANLGLYEELGRPFNPVLDWGNLGAGLGVVSDSIGRAATVVALVAVLAGLLVLIGVVAVSTVHLSGVAAGHRRATVRGVAALAAVWALAAGLSLQLSAGVPLASSSAAGIVADQIRDTRATVRDQQQFETALHAADPRATVPAAQLLTGLRGKDVLIVFVESYGQTAVQGSSFSPGVDAVLHTGTAALAQAGWSAQSAWLTSPTFGGISWLAHSTLQSGLWVDSQQRYDQLVTTQRYTLSVAFKKAGWHTVSDIPSDDTTWPAGTQFYHYDTLYDRRNVGYHGPTYSYASMPDQYTLAAFQRNELQPGHPPVMAEIDLVSSHTPWAPLPSMVAWDQVGDGSVFDPQPAASQSPDVVWRDANTVREFYGQSIQYSLTALTSWITQLDDPDLVMVMLGDHQPATTVSGVEANHQVPISIIARDPAVFTQIASWGWQPGLMPDPAAPLWPMDAFRNAFLDAFTDPPSTSGVPAAHAGR